MTNIWHCKPTLILAGVFCFVFACNGQIKTDTQNPGISAPIPKSTEQAKLLKTQGSTESDNVWCSLQHKAGNLWFGTTGEGVYRFNGKSFTQLTKKDGLNSNTAYSILEDKSGNICIGTLDGICRFVGKTFKNFNADSGMSKYFVWNMLEDRNGSIWIGTRNTGLYKYDGKAFTNFSE